MASSYQKVSLITVDEAITRGRQMLLLPRILMMAGMFFFLFPIALIVMALMDGPAFSRNVWLVVGGVILFCFIFFFYLPFLYWSKQTTRWKLWAFDNVDNVHELKIMAVQANLCPAYGTVMDKLQIQSAAEREQWKALQNRFEFPNVFKDDPAIPGETKIFYSKFHLTVNILFAFLIVAIGYTVEYFAIKNNGDTSLKIIAALIAIAPFLMIFVNLRRMFRTTPEITLSNEGLETPKSKFIPWDIIFNEKVTRTDQGKRGVKFTLSFQHPNGLENIDISDFNITHTRLERLIRVYKGRYESGIR